MCVDWISIPTYLLHHMPHENKLPTCNYYQDPSNWVKDPKLTNFELKEMSK